MTHTPSFSEIMRGRASTRAFSDEAPPRALVEEIIAEASWAPSGGNRQNWRIRALGPEAARAFLDEYQGISTDLILPAIKLALTRRGEPPEGVNALAISMAEQELNLALAPPPCMLFVYRDRPRLSTRLKDLMQGASVVLHRARQKGARRGLAFLLRSLIHSGRLLSMNDHVDTLSFGGFMYGVCLAAHHRGVRSCILSMHCIDRGAPRAVGLTRGHDLMGAIALGYAAEARGPARTQGRRRRPVDVTWGG